MKYITNDLMRALYLYIHNDPTPYNKLINNTNKPLNLTYTYHGEVLI